MTNYDFKCAGKRSRMYSWDDHIHREFLTNFPDAGSSIERIKYFAKLIDVDPVSFKWFLEGPNNVRKPTKAKVLFWLQVQKGLDKDTMLHGKQCKCKLVRTFILRD